MPTTIGSLQVWRLRTPLHIVRTEQQQASRYDQASARFSDEVAKRGLSNAGFDHFGNGDEAAALSLQAVGQEWKCAAG